MNALKEFGATAAPCWRADGLLHSLGPAFAAQIAPQPLPQPHWVACSDTLAGELGLRSWLATDAALSTLAGNGVAPGAPATLASVYSGHQFGVWAGQLGDGRALLLGEVDSPAGPMELQLKGSGLTPFSRMGDGRAVLRSSVREFLCSEAMSALGIPTTRALALVGSPQPVRRETVETAAVVTRVAPSFIRFGHFEHFAHTAADTTLLRRLLDAVIERHYPELLGAEQPAVALLRSVTERTARLLALWQSVGFCHGVMNTDNMSILGLTIDYGPFGFLDAFDPGHVCNHSDHGGRYAFARQPNVAYWNLHALAQALMPLVDGPQEAAAELLTGALEPYKTVFMDAWLSRMRAKLGLASAMDGDAELIDDLLRLMAAEKTDFTIGFRRLAGATARDLFIDREAFDAWSARHARRLAAEQRNAAEVAAGMNRTNPKFVLRNHLAQVAIEQAQAGELGEIHRLLKVLEHPFDEQPEHAAYADFPPPEAQHIEVSCSS